MRQNSADQKFSVEFLATLAAVQEEMIAKTVAAQWLEVERLVCNGFYVNLERLCAK
jgi:hypothetical protein